MKQMLMRPSAALFPAVLLVSALRGDAQLTALLFFCWLVLQLCTLCSAEAFRNAAAREPGVKRVDKRFSGAWPVLVLGGVLGGAIGVFLQGKGLISQWMLPAAAAWLIIIEQLFEERMYALSHSSDGAILGVVANVLLFAGLMIDSSEGIASPVNLSGFYTLCGAGLGMLISIIASYIIEPMHAFSLVPRNIGFFPKAAVQSLLYPAVVFAVLAILMDIEGEPFAAVFQSDFSCVFAGLILWRLSRTVCRRANDESRPLNLLLVASCTLLIIGGCFVETLTVFGFFAIIALLCSIIVYCAPSVRLYIGFVLLCVAWLYLSPYSQSHLIGIACSAVAIILNLHKAFLKKV